MASKSGLRFSSTASSPPTIKIRVPASAPTFEPVMGASTYARLLARTRSANLRVAEGAMVLESTIVVPSASDASTPCGPKSTLSTAGVSETQIQTTSAPRAASAGEAAMRAPSTFFRASGSRP